MSEIRFSEEQMKVFSEEFIPMLEKLFKIAQKNGVVGGFRVFSDGEDYATVEADGMDGWSLLKLNGEYQMKYHKSIKM